MEGYVVDALPTRGGVVLVLDGFRKVKVNTTFPIYVITDSPERIAEHPSVLHYEQEVWRDLDGKEVDLYRFELEDMEAYNYIRRRVETVNEIPTVMSQVLHRINAYPFRKVRVGKGVEMYPEEFPKVSFATVVTEDWYGPSPKGRRFVANVNGEKLQGRIDDLDLKVDVAECFGIACQKVTASVKIRRKRAPVSVRGMIEWSLVSRTLIRELEGSTIGKVLTTNEAWVAFSRRVLIPRVVPRVEKMRTLDEIRAVDKGGLVLFPRVGCFDQVSQVDFSSMYPSLIVKYNISAETVDVCNDLETEIGHSICMRETGIVPEALRWLIKRKEELKRVDEERAEAIKWILVASFGYLGYRNSKFGKIEAYELVTYFARKTLRETMVLAREYGLEVLHGIIDSLILKGERVQEFLRSAEEMTGLRLKEDRMKWILLFPRRDGRPYPMRYMGKLESGEVKVKGLIRRNLPNVVRVFVEEAVGLAEGAESCQDLEEITKDLNLLAKKYRERILNGDPRDYVIWVKGKPLIRGVRGFYDPSRGYRGRDVYYYLDYLERERQVLIDAYHGFSGN
ncbi:DNA polymerase II [Metallosphaera tengchongensis]|uniref:DNA-directed DNA polymerase n=1 Tax=Metallosphaera tengchongensis TaxID=1532350 RepID=A0A6N0NTT6_9CREN|nr:DNA polymerase domain-containing protein [Metallosphaera tengchongensis]QKR00284.1 DNA polymerase II [Metallosphaera tengchongensis]